MTNKRGGRVEGRTHAMPLRVYYEDTDASGIVYYANYLKFAERGRTEMMRELGFAHSGIVADSGVVFTVRRLSADYRLPARLDDALCVITQVVEIAGATILLDQQIRRGDVPLVVLEVLVACVGQDGRPRRVPPGLRQALALPALASRPHSSVPPSIVQKTP
ncbi:MAG: tol-pal system-associated acyl-CoA thioesterase [Thiohalocapsa sp.]